jgi:D-sedoheptulose 7-phosphate isomerase
MFVNLFLNEASKISKSLDEKVISSIIEQIAILRKNKGRIFFFGLGGSAGNCSHAVNDFRKLCKIQSFTPFDNISELSARINDEGWESCFTNWLKLFRPSKKDAIFIFSVGGGDKKKKVSLNLVDVIKFAKKKKMKIFGIVGPNGGEAWRSSNYIVRVPIFNEKNTTPLQESFQSIIWHCIISHPKLQLNKTKW